MSDSALYVERRRSNKNAHCATPDNHAPPHHQQIFDGFRSVKLDTLDTRKDADDQMARAIGNSGVRQFILKNLDRSNDGTFSWKLNIEVIEAAIENVGEGLEGPVHFDGPCLFIGGGKSDYITADDHGLIRDHFPSAEIVTVEGAGHWVHAEKPQELGTLVLDFLS